MRKTFNVDSTAKTMAIGPIRDIVGHLHLRQCKPKLRYKPFVSLNKRQYQTSYDIENRLRHSLRLIHLVKNES